MTEPENEVVERVAQALIAAWPPAWRWLPGEAEVGARAAIAAMPSPVVTVGMVTAALAAVGEHDVSLSSVRRIEVTRMIHAALNWLPTGDLK